MEKEPLLPYVSPQKRPKPVQLFCGGTLPVIPSPSLCPLPEDGEIIVPPGPSSLLPSPTTLTPSELRDQLIFVPSTSSPSDLSTPTPWLSNDPFSNTNTLPKTDLHRSRTGPAMAAINELNHVHPLQKPKFDSSSIARQALFLLLIYLFIGVVFYSLNHKNYVANETHPIVDALYFCIVTMCTIGYGGVTPKTTSTKLFSILFVLVGFGFINVLLTGMVTYVLDLQENLLLTSVQGRGRQNLFKSCILDVTNGRMRIRMKVGLALGAVVLCIGTGALVMHFVEKLDWLDSFYLSVMSVTTVGGGDLAFNSLAGRVFASIWLLVSTLAVARAFLYLAQARIDMRHMKMVNSVPQQDMTVSDFLAADFDNNMVNSVPQQDMTVSEFLAADIDNSGFTSKSEFVLYKLKEIGKIDQKDILQICNLFDRLDTRNCGKITLPDLMESHH